MRGQSLQIVDVKRSHSVVILPKKIVYKVISGSPQNLRVYHVYASMYKNIFVSSYFYITSVPYLQESMSAGDIHGNMRIIYVNMQNK